MSPPAMRAELFEASARIGWLDVRQTECCAFLYSLDHRARRSSRRVYEVVPLWSLVMEDSSTMMALQLLVLIEALCEPFGKGWAWIQMSLREAQQGHRSRRQYARGR